jgi:hypothetical protein
MSQVFNSSGSGSKGDKVSVTPKTKKLATSGPNGEYKLYPYRWSIQSFFSMCMVMSGFLMVGFSPISSSVAKIFDCEELIV